MKKLVLIAYIAITVGLLLGLFFTYQNRAKAEKDAVKIFSEVIPKSEMAIKGLQFHPNNINTGKNAIIKITNKDIAHYQVVVSQHNSELSIEPGKSSLVQFEDAGIYTLQLKAFPYIKATVVVE